MALNHFVATIMFIIFGGAEWVIISYILRRCANFFIVNYNTYASVPHLAFMMAVIQWGSFLMILIPAGIYLWTQTQRPEVQ